MDDLISRQAAIDALGDEPIVWGESELDDYDLGRKTMWNENKDALEALPPLQPERMRGKWIDCTEDGYVECPFCHSATNCDGNKDELNFCFSCGADMRGEQDAAD